MNGVTAIVRADLIIFSIIINIVLYVYLLGQRYRNEYSAKLFRRVILSIIIVAVSEAVSWMTGEIGNSGQILIHYISNAVFLGAMALPATLGMSYIDFKIFGSEAENKKRFWLYMIPTYINIAFVIYNFIDSGFLFYIAADNQYHRGIGVLISMIVVYIFLAVVLTCFFRNKQMISGRITQSILLFVFLPIIGSVLQLLFYGTTFGMPSYTLAIFLSFLILEAAELSRDQLTGLPTRMNLEQRLSYKLKSKEAFTVVLADLNYFKEINDNFGHLAGDQILVDAAKLLRRNTNFEDMVYRYGGDEFLVILECDIDIGSAFIKRCDEFIEKYNKKHPHDINFSYGYVFVRNPQEQNINELIMEVDRRMYADKAIRKGC